jgi:ABC-type antimicrobial peptide transport system permease subunit
MREFYEIRTVAVLTLINRLITAMGIMGLCLAIVGLYGLVAFAASRRTREIGIRMAVGAGRFQVLRMVLRQGMTLALAGLGLGLMASVGADRALGAMFVGGPGGDHRADPVAFVLVSVAVVLVTVVAAYIPARRASRINPTEALRCE